MDSFRRPTPTGTTEPPAQTEELLRLCDAIMRDPQAIAPELIDRFPEGSRERALLERVRSLTERAETAERRLQETRERFDLVVRGADDGLWDWDIAADEVYLSPRWKQILGYEDHEFPNRFDEWSTRLHPDDRERALATVQAHLDGRTPVYELDYRLRHKDGTYRWMRARGVALRDASGKAYRFAGSQWDITERKRAEEELREREQQYRSIFESTSDGLVITDLETRLVTAVNPAFCRMHGFTREELIGAHPTVFIHPDYHRDLARFVEVVKAGHEFRVRAVDLRKDGTPFYVEVRGAPVTYGGRPHSLGVVRDVIDQMQAYQLLEQRVEERTRELATLLDVSHNVASTLELQPLLDLILDQLKVMSDYTPCSILVLDGDAFTTVSRRVADAHALVESLVWWRFALARAGSLWEAMNRGEPVMIDDVRGDSTLAHAYRATVGELFDTSLRYVRSWLGVPLALKDRVIGAITLAKDQPNYYTPRQARLTMAIANQAAVAIENARLYQQAQKLAALEERQRLARELHDSVSQVLFSISLGARAARTLLDRDPRRAVQPVESVISLAEMGMAEMRALIFELRPESLATEGLVAALTKQAAALRARHQIAVDTRLCDEPDVPLEVKETVYRIAREALHNTVKHARAGHVEVRLACDAEAIEFEVRDDGAGFDPAGEFPGHLGLRSMRERAMRVGGTLTVESAPGAGTRIHLRIPTHHTQ